ncbi:MAG: hypothetical protein HQL32_15095, partial [Planctomycetes bacterium]|nr:hypothetical protein [Planctomycetota bacterium]
LLKVAKGKGECTSCAKGFKDGDVCTSQLIPEGEGWVRHDLCADCLEKDDKDAVAHWRINIVSKGKKKVVLSEDAIWQVLRSGKDDEELGEKPLTFILCLMMARKRKLRMVKVSKVKGQEYQTFQNISRKVEVKVKVPLLGPAAFSRLQKEIGDFFAGE